MEIEERKSDIAAEKRQPKKAEIVKKLLRRKAGATISELGTATSWQPHTVRAHLSGLRKNGATLVREERRDGTRAYRLAKAAEAPAVS